MRIAYIYDAGVIFCKETALTQIVPLDDEHATLTFGAALAELLQAGDVVALRGDLGAGKTTLARGLIRALCGVETEVPSPTYTLVQTYEAGAFPVFHFDLYRLNRPDEVFELGWDETLSGLALIEWPDKAGTHLPKFRLDITLKNAGDGRAAHLEPVGEDWQTRLDGFDL